MSDGWFLFVVLAVIGSAFVLGEFLKRRQR